MSQVRVTFKVDDNDLRSKAFIDYVRTLDFVEIDESAFRLSDPQLAAIEKGLDSLNNGRALAHDEVMRLTREKYPHLFAND